MPAEWEPHEATWISWPHNREDWPGRFTPIPWVYAEIVRKLSRVEKVRILVDTPALERQARAMLRKVGAALDAVEFFECPTDRVWTRDYAPLFLRNRRGAIGAAKWCFNGWAKYDNHKLDDAAGRLVAQRMGVETWSPEMVLEGGSVDVDGSGVLLTTEECLLSEVQARNPAMSRREIERNLRDYLGADRVVWLRNGIAGDDTHGHIDDLARFVAPGTVLIASEDDPSDVNYQPLRENHRFCSNEWPYCVVKACPCRARWCSRAFVCLRATRISISPTDSCSSPRSTTPPIASRSTRSRNASPAALSAASIARR